MDIVVSNSSNITRNCTPIFYDDSVFNLVNEATTIRTRVVTITYGFICAVGLVMNSAIILSLLAGGRKGTTFKAPSTILIFNLAIADSMLLLTLPFAIAHRHDHHWQFGDFFCKLEEILKFLSYYASVFFITAMALDRYLIMCQPSGLSHKRARVNLWIASAIVWGLALLADVPIMLFAGVDHYGFCNIIFPGKEEFFPIVFNISQDNSTRCLEELEDLLSYFEYYDEGSLEGSTFDYTDSMSDYFSDEMDESLVKPLCSHPSFKSLHIWLKCNFVVAFVIPFAIICFCYFHIIRLKSRIFGKTEKKVYMKSMTDATKDEVIKTTLSNVTSENKVEKTSNEDRNPSTEKGRILSFSSRAKMIMNILIPCLILAFLICWLPYHAWHLVQIEGVQVDMDTCSLIRDITFCLAFFNSALNPILNSFFLFNLKERFERSSAWIMKLIHFGKSPTYSSAKVRYSATCDAENREDSQPIPEVTVVSQV